MDTTIATALLEEAMKSPQVVDDLWEASHGTPADPHGLAACLRLDSRLGGSGSPTSHVAVELSHNGRLYLDYLKRAEQYPSGLKARADQQFPPFGHFPQSTVPAGFRSDGWFFKWLHGMTTPNVHTRYRLGGTSAALIIIQKPSSTRLAYPWQQAISANSFLMVWQPGAMNPRFPRISSHYVQIGTTQAYEVSYSDHRLEYAKAALLIEPGVECMIEFQSLSLAREKHLFDGFLSRLR